MTDKRTELIVLFTQYADAIEQLQALEDRQAQLIEEKVRISQSIAELITNNTPGKGNPPLLPVGAIYVNDRLHYYEVSAGDEDQPVNQFFPLTIIRPEGN